MTWAGAAQQLTFSGKSTDTPVTFEGWEGRTTRTDVQLTVGTGSNQISTYKVNCCIPVGLEGFYGRKLRRWNTKKRDGVNFDSRMRILSAAVSGPTISPGVRLATTSAIEYSYLIGLAAPITDVWLRGPGVSPAGYCWLNKGGVRK